MISRKFYNNILIRIIALLLTGWLFLFMTTKTERLFTLIGILTIVIIQILALVYYINTLNRKLFVFFSGIKNRDSNLVITDTDLDEFSKDLAYQLNEVNQQISEIKAEHEVQSQYFKNVVEHVGVGLISFKSDRNVDFINQTAKNILNLSALSHLDGLKEYCPVFYHAIVNLKKTDQQVVKFTLNNAVHQLLVKSILFKLKGEKFKLVSFQDIKYQMESQEIDSWQKLIRVLTHEITNTISPITSLATSLSRFFIKKDGQINTQHDEKTLRKTIDGLEIISDRGNGLINFVKNYRNLTLLAKPKLESVIIAELIYNVEVLLHESLEEKNIEFESKIYPFGYELMADKKLLEQLLINLLKNAIEAIPSDHNGIIRVEAYKTGQGRFIMQIIDNGKGISDKEMEEIFVPFFTTKEFGSGIGLSLARQIMRMHGGSISAQSTPEKETRFTLVF